MRVTMVTTTDNPYDPFTQFDQWYAFDTIQGYNTCSYLARIAKTSPELSPMDQAIAVEEAVDEIVDINLLGIYKKLVRDTKDLDANS